MDSRTLNRITLHVAAAGALLSGGAFLVVGGALAVGTLVGSVVALVNWLALRWVIGRVARGSTGTRTGLMALLVLKMAALIALCWALVVRWDVHALGLGIGMSSLVIGVLLGASRGETRAEMAREEG